MNSNQNLKDVNEEREKRKMEGCSRTSPTEKRKQSLDLKNLLLTLELTYTDMVNVRRAVTQQ
jgi:hypothetical protein